MPLEKLLKLEVKLLKVYDCHILPERFASQLPAVVPYQNFFRLDATLLSSCLPFCVQLSS